MIRLRSFLPMLMILALGPGARLQAQATRTWVSGVGDDANPCSRTAPGKTFAWTIGKTAANGEIDALDPGVYDPVTVNKGITLDGSAALAQVAVSAGPGIVVNAPGAVVVLRNLVLTGVGSTTFGIAFQAGAMLVVEHCRIQGFAQSGIQADAAAGRLVLRDVTVTGSPVGVSVGGGGLAADFEDLVVQGNDVGIRTLTGTVGIARSLVAGNTTCGIQAGAGTVTLTGCLLAGNGGAAVQAATGATVRTIDTGIYDNGAGFQNLGGVLASSGGNRVSGNSAGSAAPTAAISLQ